jgi:heat-inducible transcriptional repressor
MNTDAPSSPELTERQLHILAALIRAYIGLPEPVSSKQLVDENEFGISSATVRNELSLLEQLGMIRSPHTSAGRIPTEEGYRYFVRHLLQEQKLPVMEQRRIQAEFQSADKDIHKWVRTAASVLARQNNAAALVTEPRSQGARFKHLQLIGMHGPLVLLVLVLDGGDLLQQMLTLAEEADQERLTQVAAMINDQCPGETWQGIRQRAARVNDYLAQDVMELVSDILEEAEQGTSYAIHWYGFSDLLSKFEEVDGAQQALRFLDEKALLNEVLSDAIASKDESVRVIVGGDGRYDGISELSMVVSRYGTRHFAGAISVLGPTRMRYGRAISMVRYVSTLMSAMMQDVYGEGSKK